MEKEKLRVKTGAANKGIVDCLEKLVESSLRSVNELHSHERTLENMIMSLQEIIDNLTEHKDMRDSLFDPLLSTDLPYAKKKGFKPIQRSVLYQKMNFVPKNKDGSDMKPDWDDKDQEAVAGKRGSIPDDKGRIGLTGHQATFCAAEREDTARAVQRGAQGGAHGAVDARVEKVGAAGGGAPLARAGAEGEARGQDGQLWLERGAQHRPGDAEDGGEPGGCGWLV